MDILSIFSSPAAVATGLCTVATFMLLAEMFSSNRRKIDQRVNNERRRQMQEQVSSSKLFKDWKSGVGFSDRQIQQSFKQYWEGYVAQSGLQLRLKDIVRRSILCGAAIGIVPLMFSQVYLAIIAALMGLALPWIHVVLAHRRRIRKLSEQLPEVFDFMQRAVKAGQTIQNALQLAAKQSNAPVSDELAYCCEQQNLGLPYEVTLRDMANRTGVVEFQLFSIALLMQRQAGGDPTEVLANLSDLSRKRGKLAMKIRAITSEGRMQANVLSVIPFCAFAGIYFLDREYATVLLKYPYLIAGLIVAITAGILWIRQIVNFEY